jgi:acetyl esterase/lipase
MWPGVAPGSESWTQKEVEHRVPLPEGGTTRQIRNVVTPTLTVYLPDPGKANGTALVVCPGGAYRVLMLDYEGADVAEWLAARGVTAFVLKYRVQPTPQDQTTAEKENADLMAEFKASFDKSVRKLDAGRATAVADGRQAIRYIREHASQWHISPERIGIMGFSAGAGLTMGLILDHDPASRPNFAAPIYGYMDDKPVPQDAPPLFITATQDDVLVPAEQSVKIFRAWATAKKPAELHLFEQGGHGFGFRKLGMPVDHWPDLFERWLRSQRLLDPASASSK